MSLDIITDCAFTNSTEIDFKAPYEWINFSKLKIGKCTILCLWTLLQVVRLQIPRKLILKQHMNEWISVSLKSANAQRCVYHNLYLWIILHVVRLQISRKVILKHYMNELISVSMKSANAQCCVYHNLCPWIYYRLCVYKLIGKWF